MRLRGVAVALLAAFAGLLFFSSCDRGLEIHSDPGSVLLKGIVKDSLTNKPLFGVALRLNGGEFVSEFSDSSGRYALVLDFDTPSFRLQGEVTFEKEGYHTRTCTLLDRAVQDSLKHYLYRMDALLPPLGGKF